MLSHDPPASQCEARGSVSALGAVGTSEPRAVAISAPDLGVRSI
jgi:hypothetical protein